MVPYFGVGGRLKTWVKFHVIEVHYKTGGAIQVIPTYSFRSFVLIIGGCVDLMLDLTLVSLILFVRILFFPSSLM